MISVVILTKNEDTKIAECLDSVSWADEVIIIDDFSADKTKVVAQKTLPSVKIFQRALNGDFAAQHNFGLEKASGDWVMFIDADETVPNGLKKEIQEHLVNTPPNINGFSFKRQDIFLNTKLTHGETSNWKSVRLARSRAGKWEREVHEVWKITGEVAEFKTPLIHVSHETIRSLISTLNFYTTIDAVHMVKVDHVRFQFFRVFANPIGKFIQNYFFRHGFLDGFAGFVMAFMMSFNSFLVRIKIYDLEINQSATINKT